MSLEPFDKHLVFSVCPSASCINDSILNVESQENDHRLRSKILHQYQQLLIKFKQPVTPPVLSFPRFDSVWTKSSSKKHASSPSMTVASLTIISDIWCNLNVADESWLLRLRRGVQFDLLGISCIAMDAISGGTLFKEYHTAVDRTINLHGKTFWAGRRKNRCFPENFSVTHRINEWNENLKK